MKWDTMSTKNLTWQERRISTSDFPLSLIDPANNFLKNLRETIDRQKSTETIDSNKQRTARALERKEILS